MTKILNPGSAAGVSPGSFLLGTGEPDYRIEVTEALTSPWADGVLWPSSRGLGNGINQLFGDDAGNYSSPYRALVPDGQGTFDQVPYLKTKTLEYMLADTRITQLATNTTIATSTRFDTATKTIYVAETAERVFSSVRLIVSYRSEWAATNQVIGWRMGIKLGSAATLDFDRSPGAFSTVSRNIFDRVDWDVTDYFKANFGTSGSQTCVGSIAVASTNAANINSITFKLIITYAFDPNASVTRTQMVRIPIQSHASGLTTTQQEIGTDATNPVASGQIPILDTFCAELSKTFRQVYLDLYANDGESAATTAFTPTIQIDALAEVARATLSCTLVPLMLWHDQYDLTGLDTSVTHTVSMKCDRTNRMTCVGGYLVVIYEYNHTTTLANNLATYSVMVPLSYSESDSAAGKQDFGLSAGTTRDVALRMIAVLNIQEPGTPTLLQSGITSLTFVTGSASGPQQKNPSQTTFRTSTISTSSQDQLPIVYRTDGSWTLARGINRLGTEFVAGRASSPNGLFAIINYTAGIRNDVDNGNHSVNFAIRSYDSARTADTSRDAQGNRNVTLGTPYSLSGVLIEAWLRANGIIDPHALEQRQGEWDMSWSYSPRMATGNALLMSLRSIHPYTRACNLDNLQIGKIDITARRRHINPAQTIPASFGSWSWWVTYHQHSYIISGTVLIAGVPADDGKVVTIFAYGATINNPAATGAELVTTALIAGGAGAFTVAVPDNTRTYFAIYENDGFAGTSVLGTPV